MTAPLARGTAVALVAALLFGATTPLVQRFGAGFGPFTTAALLYAGAAAFAFVARSRAGGEAPLRAHHVKRLVVVALAGAVVAPAALAWGLQRANGLAASLLLNTEAAFTIALGKLLYREHVGRRVALAATLMAVGGAVLVVAKGGAGDRAGALGLIAIGGATLGWALDNALGRPLAQVDPSAVVAAKGSLGAVLSLALALGVAREARPPSLVPALGLFACGASGYGASLALYLRAQRALGAGRTASLFAAAPFAGAVLAAFLGQPMGGAPVLLAGALFGVGAWLHATESHGHKHQHAPLEHEHAHTHDDGHHAHAHDPMPAGSHSHWHRHEPIEHDHPHAPDEHHQHEHS